MTLADIQTKIYALTNTNSTSYPNANMLIDINMWYQKIVSMILDAQDETSWDDTNQTSYPIWKFNLALQRDYSIPTTLNMLKIKSLSISYDSVSIYRATPFLQSNIDLPIVDEANATAQTTLDAFMSRTSPQFEVKYNSIWLYPMPLSGDITNNGYGLAEFFRQPIEFTSSDLTTGTAVPGFDATFHPMLAYGAALEYAAPLQLPQLKVISGELQDYEVRLRNQYSAKELDRRYSLMADYNNYH